MKVLLAATAAALCLAAPLGAQERTPSHPDARVYFVNLKDGDTVTSPVTVVFRPFRRWGLPRRVPRRNTPAITTC